MSVLEAWELRPDEAALIFSVVRDSLLESRIRQVATDWMHATHTGAPVDIRRGLAARHRELIARRSPEQVARMERAKGLRA